MLVVATKAVIYKRVNGMPKYDGFEGIGNEFPKYNAGSIYKMCMSACQKECDGTCDAKCEKLCDYKKFKGKEELWQMGVYINGLHINCITF